VGFLCRLNEKEERILYTSRPGYPCHEDWRYRSFKASDLIVTIKRLEGDLIVAVIAFTFFQGGTRACERFETLARTISPNSDIRRQQLPDRERAPRPLFSMVRRIIADRGCPYPGGNRRSHRQILAMSCRFARSGHATEPAQSNICHALPQVGDLCLRQ
jgi:hypothetical protein